MHFPIVISARVASLLLLLVCLSFSGRATAQDLEVQSPAKLDHEIAELLRNKDVGALADELAATKAVTVKELLRNLIIYARAGHRERARQTLAQLAEAP